MPDEDLLEKLIDSAIDSERADTPESQPDSISCSQVLKNTGVSISLFMRNVEDAIGPMQAGILSTNTVAIFLKKFFSADTYNAFMRHRPTYIVATASALFTLSRTLGPVYQEKIQSIVDEIETENEEERRANPHLAVPFGVATSLLLLTGTLTIIYVEDKDEINNLFAKALKSLLYVGYIPEVLKLISTFLARKYQHPNLQRLKNLCSHPILEAYSVGKEVALDTIFAVYTGVNLRNGVNEKNYNAQTLLETSGFVIFILSLIVKVLAKKYNMLMNVETLLHRYDVGMKFIYVIFNYVISAMALRIPDLFQVEVFTNNLPIIISACTLPILLSIISYIFYKEHYKGLQRINCQFKSAVYYKIVESIEMCFPEGVSIPRKALRLLLKGVAYIFYTLFWIIARTAGFASWMHPYQQRELPADVELQQVLAN